MLRADETYRALGGDLELWAEATHVVRTWAVLAEDKVSTIHTALAVTLVLDRNLLRPLWLRKEWALAAHGWEGLTPLAVHRLLVDHDLHAINHNGDCDVLAFAALGTTEAEFLLEVETHCLLAGLLLATTLHCLALKDQSVDLLLHLKPLFLPLSCALRVQHTGTSSILLDTQVQWLVLALSEGGLPVPGNHLRSVDLWTSQGGSTTFHHAHQFSHGHVWHILLGLSWSFLALGDGSHGVNVAHGLSDLGSEIKLLLNTTKHLLLNSTLTDNLVDSDRLSLTNTVAASLGLDGDLWVPIGIKEDHVGCGGESDTQSTSSGRQQHDLGAAVLILKQAHGQVSASRADRTINTSSLELRSVSTALVEEVRNKIQHHGEATEDDDFLGLFDDQLVDDLLEDNELARRIDEMLSVVALLRWLMNQVRMTTDLAQLHHEVHELHPSTLTLGSCDVGSLFLKRLLNNCALRLRNVLVGPVLEISNCLDCLLNFVVGLDQTLLLGFLFAEQFVQETVLNLGDKSLIPEALHWSQRNIEENIGLFWELEVYACVLLHLATHNELEQAFRVIQYGSLQLASGEIEGFFEEGLRVGCEDFWVQPLEKSP